jgi:hypothetical protein
MLQIMPFFGLLLLALEHDTMSIHRFIDRQRLQLFEQEFEVHLHVA